MIISHSFSHLLLIIIAQTKNVLAVKVNENDYRFKMRLEANKFSMNLDDIIKHKKEVGKDNYNFLNALEKYLPTNKVVLKPV